MKAGQAGNYCLPFQSEIKKYIMQENNLKETLKNWRPMVKPYQRPNTKKAIIQVLNSFLPFLGLCYRQ